MGSPRGVSRGEDERIVALPFEVPEHLQDGVRHSVDLREERLGDDRDSHALR